VRAKQDTVIDASFVVPLIADALGPSTRVAHARAALREAGALVAPSLIVFELINAIRVGVRAKLMTEAEAGESLVDAFDLCIHIEPAPDIAVSLRIAELAEAHRLSGYDASYLELAIRTKARLATFDASLIKAAKAEGVALASSGAN